MLINYIAILIVGTLMLAVSMLFIITAGATGPNCPNLTDPTYLGFCEDADPELWK